MEPTSVAFSQNGKKLATDDGKGSIRLWDIATARQIGHRPPERGPPDEIISMAFSPDGKTLATDDDFPGPVRLWDVATGRQVGHGFGSDSPGAASEAFSPDGKILAIGTYGGSVQLWDIATAQQIGSLDTHSGQVDSVAFSPDGKTLATGDDSGAARLWDIATARSRPAAPSPAVPCPLSPWQWRSARTARPWQPTRGTARSGSGT